MAFDEVQENVGDQPATDDDGVEQAPEETLDDATDRDDNANSETDSQEEVEDSPDDEPA
jgi:hypothetical protein